MTKSTMDLVVDMIQHLIDKVEKLDTKISNDISKVHEKIDKHIQDDCSVQKDLNEHKENHHFEKTNTKMGVANWIAIVTGGVAVLIAIFK